MAKMETAKREAGVVFSKNLELVRFQSGVVPVVPEGDKEQAHEGEKPRHCAVCKAELTHISGTHRPVVLDMLWEDMAAALDVWPNSYRVRTHEDVYLEGLKARLAEQAAAQESKQPCKQNQRRGPPQDRQGRLEHSASATSRPASDLQLQAPFHFAPGRKGIEKTLARGTGDGWHCNWVALAE